MHRVIVNDYMYPCRKRILNPQLPKRIVTPALAKGICFFSFLWHMPKVTSLDFNNVLNHSTQYTPACKIGCPS